MEIHPRYDTDPVIVVDGTINDIRVPFLRQRRRLAATLTDLDAQEWAAPSRCEGWSSKDVTTSFCRIPIKNERQAMSLLT